MKLRRRALKLLLFLLAGAIVNVAVAWGAFVSEHARPIPQMRWWIAVDADQLELWRRYVTEGWPDAPMSAVTTKTLLASAESLETRTSYTLHLDPGSEATMRRIMAGIGNFHVGRIRTGFPIRSCLWEQWNGSPQHRGFVASSGHTGFRLANHILPIQPLWPGFAINTIFYAAVLWVLFAVPLKVRRCRRIKRGQCASCGYSLHGTPHIEKCPECGATA